MTTITTNHIIQSNLIEGVRDFKEIQQSIIAWQYLEHQESLQLSTILQTHNLIMQNLMPQRLGGRGSLRVTNVQVDGRVCPSWHDVPDLLDEWITKMQNWSLDFDPVKAHIDFEHIHPFRDGNGRTGRMLMWWHEIKAGLPPTLIEYDKREDYYKWFE
jgi:Fic family protein